MIDHLFRTNDEYACIREVDGMGNIKTTPGLSLLYEYSDTIVVSAESLAVRYSVR